MKKISILGSTGSIGTQSLEVITHLRYEVVALTTNKNIDLLEKQIEKYKPDIVAVVDEEKADILRKKVNINVYAGKEGLIKAATYEKADTVITAVVGTAGIIPTIEAIKSLKNIALANKETLVAAGDIVMSYIKKYKVKLTPIDSEHSAILQSMVGENKESVEKIILTCSGGPFRNYSKKQLENITVEEALNHPTWAMGAKITIDSATLMNKGFEVIEAKHLFDLDLDQIEVVVHPQSIVHSMVQYKDGSVKAQLGTPSMIIPIQYALTYPKRIENKKERLDLFDKKLEFYKPNKEKFPCLEYAYEACKIGHSMPAVMNKANDEAVQQFLQGKISYLDIPARIKKAMEEHKLIKNPNLEDITKILEK
ncbi:MAG: 1-deoxy-D-xylulose-5-phosphate reductoisomerase [Nanoarchaeota archaeon]|nr:1-deoxy-D-xylulose-5-phosphate reductoisomerase [Nanoarchaeota archaeon]MCG2718785.1 1-deoxy-D-xylulose-5-phosphate reductoisomerase [Nanoarchaeota archaeon]